MIWLFRLERNGLILFLLTKRKTMSTSSNRSFANDCPAVRGIQFPKHPHSFILSDKNAYPVKKVKKNNQ